jgi:hypothetical protein
MKSGPRRVFRYSSRYEKTLPDGSFRRRMEIHKASLARTQRLWTTQDPQPSRDPKRHLLPPKERVPVASAPSRFPSVAHRIPLLQTMAHRRNLGKDKPGYPRTPTGPLEKGSPAQRWRSGFPVGEEYRGGRRRTRLRRGKEGQGPQAASAGGHRRLRAL